MQVVLRMTSHDQSSAATLRKQPTFAGFTKLDRTDPARQRLGLAHTPPTAGGELVCSSGRTSRQWLAERSRFQGLLSICQRREATCIQHLQALPSNLSASFYNAERVTWVKCRVRRVKCRQVPRHMGQVPRNMGQVPRNKGQETASF